jgi:hypothetical protein
MQRGRQGGYAMRTEDLSHLTPEQQADWARDHIEDWPAFEAMMRNSLASLDAWRAAGNTGYPPAWVTLKALRARSDL